MSNYIATNYSAVSAAALEPAETVNAGGKSTVQFPRGRVQGYSGRVSTFYNSARGTYCETYEPVRQTPFGDVWRLESRFVAGRWLHLAYSIKGRQINLATGGFGMFEQSKLPLLFDPELERNFANAVLSNSARVDLLRFEGQGVVYRSSKDSAVGIIHDFVDL